jgi:hypothetical protein
MYKEYLDTKFETPEHKIELLKTIHSENFKKKILKRLRREFLNEKDLFYYDLVVKGDTFSCWKNGESLKK